MTRLWLTSEDSDIAKLVTSILNGSAHSLMKFFLDASTHHTVISLTQLYGPNILQKVFSLNTVLVFCSTQGDGKDPWEIGNSLANLLSFPCSRSLKA